MRIFVGIGSNLGDRAEWLRTGVKGLHEARVEPRAVSSVWETEALGGPAGQPAPDFLNVVVECETDLDPRPVLDRLLEVERRAGRERLAPNAPRNLDLDLLLMGATRIDEPGLIVPHPRMWQRRFVLEPLAELAPELTHPVTGRAIDRECARLRSTQEARRIGSLSGL